MKTLDDLSKKLEQWQKNIDDEIMDAQQRTAEQIWQDVVDNAPVKTGQYIDSIHIEGPEKKGNEISTFVGSGLVVEAKSNGNRYNLGYLLEHGTLPHAIPNAFDWGNIYGFDSEQYARTLQDTWHPGMYANPVYRMALVKNKKFYKDSIKRAWR